MVSGDDTTADVPAGFPFIGGSGEDKPADPQFDSADRSADTERRIQERVWQKVFNRAAPVVRMGRFTILDEIGRGGMGTVYAAYDESLDRKVAIKVLHSDRSSPDDQARFHREARALARLPHPNVVTVHEVGHTDDAQLYLAMEFIHGQNLRDWLCAKPNWRDIREAFLQAGRGLVAAHEAHLVHRDLKPHNMMRSFEGVVKVLDFGLVRTEHGQTPKLELPDGSQFDTTTSELSTILTMPGMLLGTPAYMAPEQLRGEVADAYSDQFSFCVAMYEGLYGHRPHQGKRLDQLLMAIERDGVAPIPSDTPVPATIHAALVRGLSVEPADRWPSMAHLLEALVHTPPRRGRQWMLTAAAAASVAGGAWWMGAPDEAEPCADASALLSGVWDEQRRAEVERSFADLSVPYARATRTWASKMLDEYADDWVEMHNEACRATAVRREQSSEMLDLRMACLHRASMELQTTVDVLANADAEVAEHVPEVIGSLWPLTRCADLNGLQSDAIPPEPAEAEAVGKVRRLLARAERMMAAGRFHATRELLGEASVLLRDLRYAPVQTEYKLLQGSLLLENGDEEEAEAVWIEALQLALRGQQRGSMVETLSHLMYRVGNISLKPSEARRYWPMLEELSRDEPEYQLLMHHSLGRLLLEEGKAREAEAEFRWAVSRVAEMSGPDHLDAISSRGNLALALADQGKYTEAEAEYRALLATLGKTLGSSHPKAGMVRSYLANVLEFQGRHEEAESEAREALSVTTAAYGADHPLVAVCRANLAQVLESRGKNPQAEKQLRTAIAINQAHYGQADPNLAILHYKLANVALAQGRSQEAEQHARRALALWLDAFGPEHPDVARARHGVALRLMGRGAYAEAETLLREAERQLSRAGSQDPFLVALVRGDLADVLAKSGQMVEAHLFVEQAWHWFDRQDAGFGSGSEDRARVAFTFASILWGIEAPEQDRVRARGLAEDAARWYRGAGPAKAESLDRVQRWLDSHAL